MNQTPQRKATEEKRWVSGGLPQLQLIQAGHGRPLSSRCEGSSAGPARRRCARCVGLTGRRCPAPCCLPTACPLPAGHRQPRSASAATSKPSEGGRGSAPCLGSPGSRPHTGTAAGRQQLSPQQGPGQHSTAPFAFSKPPCNLPSGIVRIFYFLLFIYLFFSSLQTAGRAVCRGTQLPGGKKRGQPARRQHPTPCRLPQRQAGRGSGHGTGSTARAAGAGPGGSGHPATARRSPRPPRRQGLYPSAEGYRAPARRLPTEAVLRLLRQRFVRGRPIG